MRVARNGYQDRAGMRVYVQFSKFTYTLFCLQPVRYIIGMMLVLVGGGVRMWHGTVHATVTVTVIAIRLSYVIGLHLLL